MGKMARETAHSRGMSIPQILIFSPVPIPEDMEGAGCYGREIAKSKKLPAAFAAEAKAAGFGVCHPREAAQALKTDGIHFSSDAMRALGVFAAGAVRSLLEVKQNLP